MKKLIPLLLLTALVGCAEYSGFDECMLKERQKLEGEVRGPDRQAIRSYCDSLIPKSCQDIRAERKKLFYSKEIGLEEYYYGDEPKICEGW